ncbi:hypothetical protein I4641_20265 [Waterburya agarophytonicola K14]|uniref:Uncharacterized protein n=1 Tax=Waterburya agarophytonicola KI4 TaxID=2874699 RepID=A0A964BV22_9CYAN|nr:hypothetical protein [Waterburya agarophytonicola KI4]
MPEDEKKSSVIYLPYCQILKQLSIVIARLTRVLKHHWNGAILDSVQTALNFAQTMTWKGKHPRVQLVQNHYPTGVRLTKPEMSEIESQIQRLPYAKRYPLGHLPNWFVDIFPNSE